MGNAPVTRREVPLARATFFGPNGPELPKETPAKPPRLGDVRDKGNLA
jgi:hypothetical protein